MESDWRLLLSTCNSSRLVVSIERSVGLTSSSLALLLVADALGLPVQDAELDHDDHKHDDDDDSDCHEEDFPPGDAVLAVVDHNDDVALTVVIVGVLSAGVGGSVAVSRVALVSPVLSHDAAQTIALVVAVGQVIAASLGGLGLSVDSQSQEDCYSSD